MLQKLPIWMATSIAILFIALVNISNAFASEPSVSTSFEELETQIESLLETGSIPGASIVIIEDGDVAFHKHFGVASLATDQAVFDQTIFRAGSISKSFTSIAAAILAEDNKLDLGAPVSTYLPELEITNPWETTDPVRVVHLLEHTAGFNDIAFRHYLISGAEYSVEDAVELYKPYKSRWKPGTRTSYSNSGPVIAGRIIEIVSGQSFEDYTQENLFEPLGMTRSAWTKTPELAEHISKSYYGGTDVEEPFMEIPGRPSGSLNTTALQLAQLPRLMLGRGTLDGHRFFSPETAARIERPQSTDAARAGLEFGYGLGNVASTDGKALFFGHEGSIDGFAASFAYAPDLNSGYVVMINRTSSEMTDITAAIKAYLERNVDTPQATVISLTDAQKSRLQGQYKVTVTRREFMKPLIGIGHWEGIQFDGDLMRFKRKNYVHMGNNLFQAEGEAARSLVVLDDEDGIRLQTGQATYRQAPAMEIWGKTIVIVLTGLCILLSVINVLVWILGRFIQKLKSRSRPLDRALPLIAFTLSLTSLIAPLMVMGTGNFELVGTQNLTTLSVFILSIVTPIIAVIAFWRTLKSDAPRFAKVMAYFQSVLALIICFYLFSNGWFAIQIWNA